MYHGVIIITSHVQKHQSHSTSKEFHFMHSSLNMESGREKRKKKPSKENSIFTFFHSVFAHRAYEFICDAGCWWSLMVRLGYFFVRLHFFPHHFRVSCLHYFNWRKEKKEPLADLFNREVNMQEMFTWYKNQIYVCIMTIREDEEQMKRKKIFCWMRVPSKRSHIPVNITAVRLGLEY